MNKLALMSQQLMRWFLQLIKQWYRVLESEFPDAQIFASTLGDFFSKQINYKIIEIDPEIGRNGEIVD